MASVTLSERQAAALLALADLGTLTGGTGLAGKMTADGRETSPAAAHQAANGLVLKRLARKDRDEQWRVTYELLAAGRKLAARLRDGS